MRTLLTLCLVVISLAFLSNVRAFAQITQDGQSKLYLVRKVYVGSMGNTDEAERFRLLLADELAKRGFVVVDRPEKADGVLTGALTVRVQEQVSQARVYVTLNTQQGESLWRKDFGSKRRGFFKTTDPVTLRAHDVANGLHDEWARSAKTAGVEIK
jgi:hypothetical protein